MNSTNKYHVIGFSTTGNPLCLYTAMQRAPNIESSNMQRTKNCTSIALLYYNDFNFIFRYLVFRTLVFVTLVVATSKDKSQTAFIVVVVMPLIVSGWVYANTSLPSGLVAT